MNRKLSSAMIAWAVFCWSLLLTSWGRSLTLEIGEFRLGLMGLSFFLIVLPLLSGILVRYGWLHFTVSLWVLAQAVIYGKTLRLFGEIPNIVLSANGTLTLIVFPVLVRFAIMIRQHHLRRMSLCDQTETALSDALDQLANLGIGAESSEESAGGRLYEALARAAAVHSHLKTHLAGYGP